MPVDPLTALSVREIKVLRLLGVGISNGQNAKELKLTSGIVKGYVSKVLRKVGVADRTQVALMVARHWAE